MGAWGTFWSLPGFTQRVKARVDFGLSAAGAKSQGARVEAACSDRLTAYESLAAWSDYLERVRIVEDLERRFLLERASPNATPGRDVLSTLL